MYAATISGGPTSAAEMVARVSAAIVQREDGDDLQINHQDKADTLLGILSTLYHNLPEHIDNSELDHFKNIGTSLRLSHEISKKKRKEAQKSNANKYDTPSILSYLPC